MKNNFPSRDHVMLLVMLALIYSTGLHAQQHTPDKKVKKITSISELRKVIKQVKQMRSGITLFQANKPAKVVGCKVTRCRVGYNVSSGSVIKSSAGDISTGLLFNVPRSQKREYYR